TCRDTLEPRKVFTTGSFAGLLRRGILPVVFCGARLTGAAMGRRVGEKGSRNTYPGRRSSVWSTGSSSSASMAGRLFGSPALEVKEDSGQGNRVRTSTA